LGSQRLHPLLGRCSTRPHTVASAYHCPSPSLHLYQCRVCLQQPERQVHGAVQGDGRGQLGAGLLPASNLGIRSLTPVDSGLEAGASPVLLRRPLPVGSSLRPARPLGNHAAQRSHREAGGAPPVHPIPGARGTAAGPAGLLHRLLHAVGEHIIPAQPSDLVRMVTRNRMEMLCPTARSSSGTASSTRPDKTYADPKPDASRVPRSLVPSAHATFLARIRQRAIGYLYVRTCSKVYAGYGAASWNKTRSAVAEVEYEPRVLFPGIRFIVTDLRLSSRQSYASTTDVTQRSSGSRKASRRHIGHGSHVVSSWSMKCADS
jgi:hypothetical protein